MVALNFLYGESSPKAGALPPHDRFYDESFEWPKTPLQQNAERAYRRAFMKAARGAASWGKIDEKVIDKAWKERRRVREAAQIYVPSAVMFGDPSMDSEQIVYRPGHQVEASRTRGRVHGFEFVRQCWEALV